MRKIISLLSAAALLGGMLSACGADGGGTQGADSDAGQIVLSDDGVTVDGAEAAAESGSAVYTAHDIVYYEAGQDFTYGEGTEADEHTAEEAQDLRFAGAGGSLLLKDASGRTLGAVTGIYLPTDETSVKPLDET